MKKIIFSLLAIFSIYGYAFSLNITNTSSSNLDNYNGKIILDEWINAISKTSNLVALTKDNNSFLTKGDISNLWSQINIICKNGKITKIYNSHNSWNGSIDSATLSYGYSHHSYTSSLTVECKPITSPAKIIQQNTMNINYQTISKPENNPFSQNYNLSSSTNPTVTPKEVKNYLIPWKNIKNQPNFVNILYLQLKTIWNLSDNVLLQHSNLKFSDMFQSSQEFNDYENWLNKFQNYDTISWFVNAFTWTVWLKDIWIAQDVINWLLKCLNNNTCNHIIKFKHNPLDKFDVYKFSEVEYQLYKRPSLNILDSSIEYYQNLQNICKNPPSVPSDDFLTNQINYICKNLITTNINPNNQSEVTNFQLWYALWIRVKNLENIKKNIPTSWINLAWIFNIYRELNNLTLWTDKINIIKKVSEEPTLTWKYEKFKKIFEKDLEELKSNKITDTENQIKKMNIINTDIDAFTPWSNLNKTIKNNKPNINLFDDNNFNINNWIVEIKWIWISKNTNNLNSDSNKIASAKLEMDSYLYYKNLKITFSNWNSKNFKKIYQSLKWKYKIANKWRYKQWIYINSSEKNDLQKDFNDCYNDDDNWSKVCIGPICFKSLKENYYECIKKALKKHDRAIVHCDFFEGCYLKYKKWDD